MESEKLIQKLGFSPKENASEIFHKSYNGYTIKIDFENRQFDFGNKITLERETTKNFAQSENWVVLECVDRLLTKGYKPENIILEKQYKVGHGASGGWLDILVTREDGSAYLMIECKTWGKEFEKELKKIEKDGGQLFTYFQQDKSADVLMLYASKLDENKILYKNEIIKIEEHYREAGNVEDVYDRWNKVTNDNGIFDDWVSPYLFESKKLLKRDLKTLSEEDSKKIFHEFLSILRKHSVSDKPNAFNKIFNLFLAKLFDEKKKDNKELDFQWKEHKDNEVDFQIRLINLYKSGMYNFLEKEVKGISDDMFSYKTQEELLERKKHILLLDKIFDIKEVFDEETFEDNHKVLKEVVQLLQKFRIRYPRKQQHLSDFFERLLKTGLKQEVGQYFTPLPITRFIVRSLPVSQYIKKQLNRSIPELPAVIDYGAGSGHFLTEIMEEYQRVIENDIDALKLETDDAETSVNAWRINKYDWASRYIYGIEKDYRLVKVAKVGCYFYGDGLAQVILGDGLDSFKHSKSYRGLLKKNAKKPQFSFVVSNPPYAVGSFKGNLKNACASKDFKLFKNLTDRSSEIECLFVERTKQLLKTDGIASIILPSSILNRSGIYAQAREIILKAFDVIAIVELASATFMATGTSTVILFLKRREDDIVKQVKKSIDISFTNTRDNSIQNIEQPIAKYLTHVWQNISFDDYKTLLQKSPNEAVKHNEIFNEYKKLKAKKGEDKLANVLEIEKEKLLYFILSYKQKVVLVKTGHKAKEKQFLGYEFSNRRGSEGMHPIERSKTVDECTQLYDMKDFANPKKASTYIYKAFTENNFDLEIPESLKENVSYQNLVDMLTFDRADFEQNISLSVKKEVKIESRWEKINIGEIINEQSKSKIQVGTAKDSEQGSFPFFTSGKNIYRYTDFLVDGENIYLSTGGNAIVKYYKGKASYSTDTFVINSQNENKAKTKFIFYLLENVIDLINEFYFTGIGLKHLQKTDFRNIKIPLPPLDIQQKIVSEIKVLEKKEEKAVYEVEGLRKNIKDIFQNISKNESYITEICEDIFAGGDKPKNFSKNKTTDLIFPVYANGLENNGLVGYTDKYRVEKPSVTVSARGTIGFPIARDERFTPIVRLIVIIPKQGVSIKYVEGILKNIEITSSGSVIPQLTVPMVKNIKIPLPPISDQQKIVAKVETIEQKITELQTKTAEIPKQKEAILKKYLE